MYADSDRGLRVHMNVVLQWLGKRVKSASQVPVGTPEELGVQRRLEGSKLLASLQRRVEPLELKELWAALRDRPPKDHDERDNRRRAHGFPPLPLFKEWSKIGGRYAPGDELWTYVTSGTGGLAIVRDGSVVAEVTTVHYQRQNS